jgi:hypothetical protein
VALAAAAATAWLAAGAAAAPSTTQPQTIYRAKVVLTDARIGIKPGRVLRGALVMFQVRNATTKPRDFFIGGILVRSLKPGASRDFQLQFLARGKYPYYSKGHPGKKITGSFEVT